ncbi:hypothetical protein ACQ3I4_09585 [Zafaria sp. Z1313]|nr:hypothetical protein [Zafaria sp. J156]MEE1621830.1 hypothetical protein [Zafaria sp. J156]
MSFPSHWPSKVGDGTSLSDAATRLGKHGTTVREAVEATQTK